MSGCVRIALARNARFSFRSSCASPIDISNSAHAFSTASRVRISHVVVVVVVVARPPRLAVRRAFPRSLALARGNSRAFDTARAKLRRIVARRRASPRARPSRRRPRRPDAASEGGARGAQSVRVLKCLRGLP
jgi:hypothetical protein